MKFFLWMAYGNSDRYYGGGSSMLPFQGVCQGNRVGPAIWLVTSIILMNMVKTNGYQVSIFSPITKQPTNLIGLLYVDDCDLFAVDMDGTHPRRAIARLQQNIDLWQGSLAATGGLLSAKKSLWCLLAM